MNQCEPELNFVTTLGLDFPFQINYGNTPTLNWRIRNAESGWDLIPDTSSTYHYSPEITNRSLKEILITSWVGVKLICLYLGCNLAHSFRKETPVLKVFIFNQGCPYVTDKPSISSFKLISRTTPPEIKHSESHEMCHLFWKIYLPSQVVGKEIDYPFILIIHLQ
jgi:hypothetical protein